MNTPVAETVTLPKADLEKLLQRTGDDIANVLEQMDKGNWTDSLGHHARNNRRIHEIAACLILIGGFRSRYLNYLEMVGLPDDDHPAMARLKD